MRLVPSPIELVHPLPVTVLSGLGGVKIFFAFGFWNTNVFTALAHPVRATRRTVHRVVLIQRGSTVGFIGFLLPLRFALTLSYWFFLALSKAEGLFAPRQEICFFFPRQLRWYG